MDGDLQRDQQQQQRDWSQVLELVVPHIDTREMHVRLSTVSQHTQHVVQAHIRANIASFLSQYLGYGSWLPSELRKKQQSRGLSRKLPASVKWLCRLAGAEAMGGAAAATAVLSGDHFSLKLDDAAAVVVETGLRLTDERVAAAAAGAAESRKHRAGITVAWHVAELLEATPPEKTADQHSGLSPLMRFACTAERNDQVPAELVEWAAAMSPQQLYGVLLVMAAGKRVHAEAFQLLLNSFVLKHEQQSPEPAAEDTTTASSTTTTSASSAQVRLQHLLLQLLRASLNEGNKQELCVGAIVGATLSLPAHMHPDATTCLELLVLADSHCPEAIPHLASFAGVKTLPQEVFDGLLCGHTCAPRGRLCSAVKHLLKLPHAQHITSTQLSRLLVRCMDPPLLRIDPGLEAFISLPVVEDMSSEDALYVLKAAATYDGRLLAATNGKAKDNQRVWGTYEGLAEQLVEADALELFSHVINYRWHELIPTLMSSDTLMLTLSSQGVSTVIRELVASGLWLNHHNTGYDKVQLQDVVLQGGFVQGFDEDFSFEVMHTLGELGHAMSPVMCKVDSAMYISSEQVATLLKLALDNGEPTDLYNLASFSAAVELESDFVLEVVTRLLNEWPVSASRSMEFVAGPWHGCSEHMHNRPEALANLLKLPAADEFSAEACVALATTAAKACNLEAFAELCKGLPQLQSASKDMSLALLLPLYDLAVDKGDDTAVAHLIDLSASQQLSAHHLQSLLLLAIQKATQVKSSTDAAIWYKEERKLAAHLLQCRTKVVRLLLDAQSDRRTPCGVSELLQACIVHGLAGTARTLLQEPAAQQLGTEQLEELLLMHLTQLARQYSNKEEVAQVLGLLVEHPTAKTLDAAAVSRLIVGHGAFATTAAAANDKIDREHFADDFPKDHDAGLFKPLELLVGQPVVQQLDAAGLVSVLTAAVEV